MSYYSNDENGEYSSRIYWFITGSHVEFCSFCGRQLFKRKISPTMMGGVFVFLFGCLLHLCTHNTHQIVSEFINFVCFWILLICYKIMRWVLCVRLVWVVGVSIRASDSLQRWWGVFSSFDGCALTFLCCFVGALHVLPLRFLLFFGLCCAFSLCCSLSLCACDGEDWVLMARGPTSFRRCLEIHLSQHSPGMMETVGFLSAHSSFVCGRRISSDPNSSPETMCLCDLCHVVPPISRFFVVACRCVAHAAQGCKLREDGANEDHIALRRAFMEVWVKLFGVLGDPLKCAVKWFPCVGVWWNNVFIVFTGTRKPLRTFISSFSDMEGAGHSPNPPLIHQILDHKNSFNNTFPLRHLGEEVSQTPSKLSDGFSFPQ